MFIDRRGTGALKYDGVADKFGVAREDTLSMWIADMDTAIPDFIHRATADYLHSAQVGYHTMPVCESIANWLSGPSNLISPATVVPVTSLVDTLFSSVALYSEPGDSIAVFSPVYGPFFEAIEQQGRHIVNLPMRFDGRLYEPDLANVPTDVKMVLICNPNNPTGTCWQADKLAALAEFCCRHHITLISDEVHRDFMFAGQFSSVLDVPTAFARCCVMLGSPSKSFNLSGVGPAAYAVIPDEGKRKEMAEWIERRHLAPSSLAKLVTRTAYTYGQPWLRSVVQAIAQHRRYVTAQPLPAVFTLLLGQGTYFAWLDARKLGADPKQQLLENYRLALGDGAQFGAPGFFRLNLAASSIIISQVVGRLQQAQHSKF